MTRHDESTERLQAVAPGPERGSRRARRQQLRRRRRLALGAAGVVTLIAVIGLLGGGDALPAKLSIGGVDVGGLSEGAARVKLTESGRQAMERRVRLTSSGDGTFDTTIAAEAIVSAPLIDEALTEARSSRSRFGRALARVGLAGERRIPLRFAFREGGIGRVLRQAQAALGEKPVSATVAVQGEQIVTTAAEAGRAIDRPLLEQRLAELPDVVEVPVREARPPGDDDDAAKAKALAERVLATQRQITLAKVSAPLTNRVILRSLRFPVRKSAIAVELDADVLRSALVRPLQANERPARDARFEIRGQRAVVIPSRPARRLDGAALSTAITANPDAPTVAAKVALSPAEFTTKDANALKIVEKVAEFTTPYDCCPARVTNIQRAAQILDGTILSAGKRFSLNDALGQRTPDRGFVEAGTIAAGELVDTYGGGVSQVATTMYNAAFFAGLALEAHTPHEFWISRYPMGREATISWRTPDLVFRNDWDAAILMSVRAGSNSVTVAFYSSKLGRRVETSTGDQTDFTEPKTVERQNPDLEPGAREVIQTAGARGFAISYTRKVYRGDKLTREETFRWNYRPQNAIVELGPPLPEEPEEPTEPGGETPPGTGTGTTPTTTAPTTPTAPSP